MNKKKKKPLIEKEEKQQLTSILQKTKKYLIAAMSVLVSVVIPCRFIPGPYDDLAVILLGFFIITVMIFIDIFSKNIPDEDEYMHQASRIAHSAGNIKQQYDYEEQEKLRKLEKEKKEKKKLEEKKKRLEERKKRYRYSSYSSFDTDDFFNAALKRSDEHIKARANSRKQEENKK